MRHLDIIEEIFALAAEADAALWLRGGWAMDFALGQVTREHVDIDLFAWAVDAERLTRVLTDHDYDRTPNDHPLLQLDFSRHGVEINIGLLARSADGQVVIPHGESAGAAWPEGMLDGPPGRLGGLVCPMVSVPAQIEIKEKMPIWVPARPRREKDTLDIERLRAYISNT
ncbi:hypothetical protein Rhe02_14080 [Rhizocola hellebori]|uniref:Aminoglycoside adenylyltransferase n=1 Tax=Rhizocola hellebori TaxID=1392758 RepID=A0A8J3VEI1_9ACTN|nr:aminoglycoside adenylyltransferase [Rhizocola hellebori]GIH03341.1 hypothetical protein Rhe02_14080 [Rhizocola hellebori]